MRLRLSVAPFPGEPAHSIVSRIAARNGASFAQDFCADMNLSWKAITSGDQAELTDMAFLAGLSIRELGSSSVRTSDHHNYDLNGEHLTAKTLDRGVLKVCPQCLLEDMDASGPLSRHCRVEWLLNHYQVCHIHGALMLTLPKAEYPRCKNDFYQRIKDHWKQIVAAAGSRNAESYNLRWPVYLANRIRGRATDTWCDQFDLDITCRFALCLGTVLRFGSQVNPSELSGEEMAVVLAEAFEVFSVEANAVRAAFRGVRKRSVSLNPGFYTDFGALARWLARIDHLDSKFVELLDLAAEHLGISRPSLQRLAQSKMLTPRFDLPSMAPVYHPEDMSDFENSVFTHARILSQIPTGHIPIFKLCTHAKCYFEEIIEVASAGRLLSLCRLPCAQGIKDCFADLEDLRDQLQEPAHDGHTKQEVKRLLRVNDPTVTLPVKRALLRSSMVRHPRSRRPMALISSEALSEFLGVHATLGMMAHAARTQAKHVATKLEKSGIEPLPLGDRFSKIYLRTPDLEHLFQPGEIGSQQHDCGKPTDHTPGVRT
ncbi:TniQ family protein [uncultured Roseobacter sp.]|uniref:TniQ family protein n=1 Tax=uncultured Roseobacter sp. TaxID=114847 RepID=UPI00261F920F|nr:TniQ family protein [uncultured Roseobacter sp.]